MMVLDPFLYGFLLVFSYLFGGIALIVLICYSVFSSNHIWVMGEEKGQGTVKVSLKGKPTHPEAKEELRYRRTWKLVLSVLVALAATFLLWSTLSGETARQDAASHQIRLNTVREFAEGYLLDAPTDEQVEKLSNSEPVSLPIAFSDGTIQQVELTYGNWFWGSSYLLVDESVEGYVAKGDLISFPTELQRAWQLQGLIRDKISERYGLSLTEDQITELELPSEIPSTLTRYGSIPLTLAAQDGYINIEATLIWDGDFKLVGIPGGDAELQELPSAQEMAR